jgi:hypothetical protein
VANAWTRSYASGHRARITKRFTTTYSLEVFTERGDPLFRFALLLPSLQLAQETADTVVSSQSEPWIPARRGTFEADIAELKGMSRLSS